MLAIGSTKVDQNVSQDQYPTRQTATILPETGATLPVTDGNKCPAIGGKSGLAASNLATDGKNGRRRPSAWRPNARDGSQEWLDMEKAAALLQKCVCRSLAAS